jgi:outer membrane lipoprotein-sorting protein
MRGRWYALGLALTALLATGRLHAGIAGAEPRRIIDAMAAAIENVHDYTMTLVIQEWDGETLGRADTLVTKWARPFKVYYKRLSEPHLGREVLYAQGWNDGKLKVSVRAWPVNIGLDLNPHGTLAMAEAKHPVDETSLIYLVQMVLDNVRLAFERGELLLEDGGSEKILGRECRVVRVYSAQSLTDYTIQRGETLWDVEKKFHSAIAPLLRENRAFGWETPADAKPGQTIRIPRYYASRTELWIDTETALPLRTELYDSHGEIFERFEHRDLRVNVGLTANDFSPHNPEYKF